MGTLAWITVNLDSKVHGWHSAACKLLMANRRRKAQPHRDLLNAITSSAPFLGLYFFQCRRPAIMGFDSRTTHWSQTALSTEY